MKLSMLQSLSMFFLLSLIGVTSYANESVVNAVVAELAKTYKIEKVVNTELEGPVKKLAAPVYLVEITNDTSVAVSSDFDGTYVVSIVFTKSSISNSMLSKMEYFMDVYWDSLRKHSSSLGSYSFGYYKNRTYTSRISINKNSKKLLLNALNEAIVAYQEAE